MHQDIQSNVGESVVAGTGCVNLRKNTDSDVVIRDYALKKSKKATI